MSQRHLLRSHLLIATAGAVGGAINAALCLAKFPVPVKDDPEFKWVIVPGGAMHGAILAAIAVGAAVLMARWRWPRRLLILPIVGWVAGYLSWIPLDHWAFGDSWRESFLWPFGSNSPPERLLHTFQMFGFVAIVYVLLAGIVGVRGSLPRHLIPAVVAGVLGSLWFWMEFEPWYFSVLHGTIWGALVGAAAWRTNWSFLTDQSRNP